jgi:hypothetical protein
MVILPAVGPCPWAQQLGLEPYASDLNPVAVLINKVSIEMSKLATISTSPFGSIAGIIGLYIHLLRLSGTLRISLHLNFDKTKHMS